MTTGIRQLRISKGLTQSELGKLSGLSQQKISQLELGLRPRKTDLEKIKSALLTETKGNGPK